MRRALIPGRCQRVRTKRGPMTGSTSNPESKDSLMRNCASEVCAPRIPEMTNRYDINRSSFSSRATLAP